MFPVPKGAAARWITSVAAGAFVFFAPGTVAAQSPCGPSWTVSLGDTLAEIAASCGTTVSALARANDDITDPDVIHVGQVIRIPGGGAPPDDEPNGDERTHTVSAGETLAGIASRYGTTVSAIARANASVTNPNIIHVGQVLTIPGVAPRPSPPPARPEPREAHASISPDSGPPGTTVRLTGSGLPANAHVQVGRGLARSEYEVVERVHSDAQGNVSTTATVPSHADPGDRWVFVLVTEDPRVRAVSGEFQVTAGEPESGRVEVTGVLTREGVECPALRADDGSLYTLAGGTGDFGPGDRVRVTGTQAQVSICQQGTTIEVESIRPAGT